MLNIQLLEAIYSGASTIFYVTYRLRSLYERDSFGKDSPSNIFNLWYLGSVGLRVPWRYRIAILPTGEAPTSTVRSDLMQVDCYSKDCIFHRIQIILKASLQPCAPTILPSTWFFCSLSHIWWRSSLMVSPSPLGHMMILVETFL